MKNKKKIWNKILYILLFGGLTSAFFSPLFVLNNNPSNIQKNNNIDLTNNQNTLNVDNSNQKIEPLSTTSTTIINTFYQLTGIDESYKKSVTSTTASDQDYLYSNIYPSQHFGQNWLGVTQDKYDLSDKQNSITKILDSIKQLIIDNSQPDNSNPCIQGLPSGFDTSNIQIVGENTANPHFYVDNYNGVINVEIQINKYINEYGVLIEPSSSGDFSNAMGPTKIQLSGFRKAVGPTNFMSFVNTQGKLSGYDGLINISNINDFAKNNGNIQYLINTYNQFLTSGIICNLSQNEGTQILSPSGEQIIAYPGLAKLKTNFQFKNYFKDQYIDENYVIYDDYAPNRKKIGSYIFDTTDPMNISFSVSNENYNPDNILYTYVNESSYKISSQFTGTKASDSLSVDGDKNINIMLDYAIKNNNLIENQVLNYTPDDQSNQKQDTTLSIVSKKANDIKGEIYLEVKLSGYIYNGSDTPTKVLNNDKRVYNVTLTGFKKQEPTSIAPIIDATALDFTIDGKKTSDTLPSVISLKDNNIPNQQDQNKEYLKNILIDATKLNIGLTGLPYDINDNSNNTDNSFNPIFEYWENPLNANGIYCYTPNDLTGELVVKFKLNKYYSPVDGTLVSSQTNPLELTTKIINLAKNTNAVFVQNGGTNGIPFIPYGDDRESSNLDSNLNPNSVLPKEIFKNDSFAKVSVFQNSFLNINTNVLYKKGENGQNVPPTIDDMKNINIQSYDQTATVNDPLTSNLTGMVNLHYTISGVNDPNNGLPINGDFTTLFNNFKKVTPTIINTNLDVSELKLYAVDLLYASDFVQSVYNDILFKTGNDANNVICKKYVLELFKYATGIPSVIYDEIYDTANNTQNISSNIIVQNNTFNDDQKNKYSKDGSFPVNIDFKLYYDENGNLINNNPLKTKINFSGFLSPQQTVVKAQISGDNTKLASDYNTEAKLKEYIKQKQSIPGENLFENIPNLFLNDDNSYSISNINVDNTTGSINADVTLKQNYFDANGNFITANNQPTTAPTFKIYINGFKTVANTTIYQNISLSDLYVDGKPLAQVGTNLMQYLYYDVDNSLYSPNKIRTKSDDPCNVNAVGTNFDLQTIINDNINVFINNPYTSSNSSNLDPYPNDGIDYFNITNAIADFNNGQIKFTLDLNYYYGQEGSNNAFPIIADKNNNINPLQANIIISGFDQVNQPTTPAMLPVDVSQPNSPFYNNFKNVSLNYVFNNQANDDVKNLFLYPITDDTFPGNSNSVLHSLFNNFPNNTIDQSDILGVSKIEKTDVNNGLSVTFDLKNIYVLDTSNNSTDKNIVIGSNSLTVDFIGFNTSGKTSVLPEVDLSKINESVIDFSKYTFSGNNADDLNQVTNKKVKVKDIINDVSNPYNIQLCLGNLFEDTFIQIIKQIIIQNSDAFIDWNGASVTTDQSGQPINLADSIDVTFGDKPFDASTGTLTCQLILNAYYDSDGALSDKQGQPLTEEIKIRGFKIYSPTVINQSTYNIDKVSISNLSDNSVFFPSQWVNNLTHNDLNKDFTNILSVAFNDEYNEHSDQIKDLNSYIDMLVTNNPTNKINNNTIDNILNDWQKKSVINNKNQTKTTVNVADLNGFNDENGLFTFSLELNNFFDQNGVWTSIDSQSANQTNQKNSSTLTNDQASDQSKPFKIDGYYIYFSQSAASKTNFEKTTANVSDFSNYINNFSKIDNNTLRYFSKKVFSNLQQSKEFISPYLTSNTLASDFYKNVIQNQNNRLIFNDLFRFLATMSVDFNQSSYVTLNSNQNQNKSWLVYNNPFYAYNTNLVNNAFISDIDSINNVLVECKYDIYPANVTYDDKTGTITFKNVQFVNSIKFDEISNAENISGEQAQSDPNLVVVKDLSITGFYKNTRDVDLVVIISVVGASIGFLIICGLLIWFIIRKVRKY